MRDISPGRSAAVRAVAAALAGKGFAAETLQAERGTLEPREAGLAAEIALGTLRHVVTIERVLKALADVDLPRTPRIVRAILYTGVFQVVWMERVPTFAAVDQAVELARQRAGGRAPALVNAVLRRVTGGIREAGVAWERLHPGQVRTTWDRACQFRQAVLPEPVGEDGLMAHLAAASGERLPRFRELVARYGVAKAEEVAWASQAVPPTVLQRQALRIDEEAFARAVHEQLGAEIEVVGGAAFVPPGTAFGSSALFRDGLAFVQDQTAHAAARAVAARPGERALDLCAAPGGKSIVLALDAEDRGEVVACDIDAERLARVAANADRLGLASIRPRLIDGASTGREGMAIHGGDCTDSGGGGDPLAAVGSFDAALVDAPCSNTGVIARRPEARLGLTPAKLASLVQMQRDLLRRAAKLVRPGGRLVYSTCSIEPAENEEIVAELLGQHHGKAALCPTRESTLPPSRWRMEHEETTLPAWGARWSAWRDGGYVARLERMA